MTSIGVVIPVRNQARFLDEALDSVDAQTVATAQVVVVDDHSTDGSGDVARARGATVVLNPGSGVVTARNRGAAELTTDLIAFLDGDDLFTPTHHEELLSAMAGGHASVGMIEEFFDPGREEELASKYKLKTGPLRGGLLGSTLVSRELFESFGGFEEGANDVFGFFDRLGDPPSTDAVVLRRRIHGENRSIVDRDEIRAEYLRAARAAIVARRRETQ